MTNGVNFTEPLVDAPFKMNWFVKSFPKNVKIIRKEHHKSLIRAVLDELKTRRLVLWEYVRRGMTTHQM